MQAVIFDLDGTIILNEADWEEAFVQVATEEGMRIPTEARLVNGWMHEPGLGLAANWRRLGQEKLLADELALKTGKKYLKNLRDGEIDIAVREGVMEIVELCREKELRTALCTGSTWNAVERELEQLQLYLAFDVTTTGEEVLMMKPDPEIYVLATQKLGVEPKECWVIEDSIAGVRSAKEAGCRVVGVVSDYAPAEILKAAGAEVAVEELNEILTMGIV